MQAKLKSHSLINAAAGLMLAVSPLLSQASTIVDTGPGSSGNTGGWSLDQFESLAAEFTVNQNTTIDSIMGWIGGDSVTGTIALYSADAGTGLPGTQLYSTTVPFNPPENAGNNAWYGASDLSWNVGPGDYWASFEVRGNQTNAAWMIGDAANPIPSYAFTSNGVWNPYPLNVGVKIDGLAPVPVPAAFWLFGSALGGIGICSRRKPARSPASLPAGDAERA